MAVEFQVAVDHWIRKAKGNADLALRATVFDALAAVKALTPVRTGNLRANWTVVKGDEALPAAGATDDAMRVIETLHYGDKVAIVNPVIYAARVEYGFVGTDSLGRHYDQKGRGMMQQTVAMLPEIARRATQRVIAGGETGLRQGVPA